MTTYATVRSVLDRLPSVQHACDLDLLLFFSRHPRALLTSEQLVAYLGYDRDRIALSLDGLIEAGLLTFFGNTRSSRDVPQRHCRRRRTPLPGRGAHPLPTVTRLVDDLLDVARIVSSGYSRVQRSFRLDPNRSWGFLRLRSGHDEHDAPGRKNKSLTGSQLLG